MFNTLMYAKKLEAAGICREQAEVHVQIMAEIVEDNLATKQDMQEFQKNINKSIQTAIQNLEYKIVLKLGAFIAAMATICIGAVSLWLQYRPH